MSDSIAQQKTSRPRLGFLGVGWIGRHRLEAIADSGVAEVSVVADPTPTAVAEARRKVPQARVARGLEELLAQGVDGVVIATPSAFHADQAVAALEQGMAIFCQKPLGRTAAEVRRVVDAARASGALLGVDLSYRFTDGMRLLRERVQAGALGQVFSASLVFHNAYGPDKAWFYDPALSGGGCIMDLGIHLVDLALWVLGFPAVERVDSHLYAAGVRLSGRGSGMCEDYAAAQLQLAGGVAVQLACSWKVSAGQDAVIEAAFYGTRGGAAFRNVNGSFYDFTAELFRGTAREPLSGPPDAWGGRAAVDWASRLARGEGFDPECERLVTVAEALDRLYG